MAAYLSSTCRIRIRNVDARLSAKIDELSERLCDLGHFDGVHHLASIVRSPRSGLERVTTDGCIVAKQTGWGLRESDEFGGNRRPYRIGRPHQHSCNDRRPGTTNHIRDVMRADIDARHNQKRGGDGEEYGAARMMV